MRRFLYVLMALQCCTIVFLSKKLSEWSFDNDSMRLAYRAGCMSTKVELDGRCDQKATLFKNTLQHFGEQYK